MAYKHQHALGHLPMCNAPQCADTRQLGMELFALYLCYLSKAHKIQLVDA